MEIYQLRYFVEVAKRENMNHVTRDLGVSTPALSKAISLLESELGIQLFDRFGKRLKLSQSGKAFLNKAGAILDLIQEATVATKRTPSTLNVTVAGRELFLGLVGIPFIERLRQKFPEVQISFIDSSGEDALKSAANGNSDFAISTQKPPVSFAQKQVYEFEMITCLSKNHPLHKQVKSGQVFSISKITEQAFVAPNAIVYGNMGARTSYDGWRDDIHPRKIRYVTSSLKLISDLVQSGAAIAYLPKFYAEQMDFERIKIRGCEFSCEQKVYLSTAKHEKIGWISNAIFSFKM